MGYIVKFRKIIVIVEYYSIMKYATKVMNVEEFSKVESNHPLTQYKHFDLEAQLTNKKLKKTIPKSIRNKVLSLPEIQSEIRNNKIESILYENKSDI